MKRKVSSSYSYCLLLTGIAVWVAIVTGRSFTIWFDWETVRFFVQPRPGQYRWLSPWWSGWVDLSDYGIVVASQTLRPLMTWSFQFESILFADWAPGYNILNFATHLICCLLLMRLLRKLHVAPVISLLFALLFAVHPLTTVPLWILADRAEVFVLLGGLTALLAYPSRPFIVLSGLFIALYSKESAISIPAWLIVYDFLFLDTTGPSLTTVKKRARRLLPPIVLTILYLVHRTVVFSGIGGYRSIDHGLLTNMLDIFYQNIAWLLTLPHGKTWITLSFLVIIFAFLLLTRSRTALFGILWLLLFFIPTNNLCHKWYLYTSVAALMTLFAGLAHHGYTHARLAKPLSIIILLVAVYLSILSYAELYHQKRNADLPINLATTLKEKIPSIPAGTRLDFVLPPTVKKNELKGHYFNPLNFKVEAYKSPIESIVWDLNSTRYLPDTTPVWTRSVEAAIRLKYNDISLRVLLIDYNEPSLDNAIRVLYNPPSELNLSANHENHFDPSKNR